MPIQVELREEWGVSGINHKNHMSSYVYMTLHLPPFRSPQNSPGVIASDSPMTNSKGFPRTRELSKQVPIRQATHVVDPPTRRPGNRWPVSQTWVVCWTANLFSIFLDKPTRFCRSPINGTGMKRLWPCLTKSPLVGLLIQVWRFLDDTLVWCEACARHMARVSWMSRWNLKRLEKYWDQ